MNGAALLERLVIPTDDLAVDADGVLLVGGQRADTLLKQFGSPLYVTIEQTIRHNFRTFLTAFEKHWPAGVDVFYAMKTNNALAIRAILNQEGAGGECFGSAEYRASLETGLPGERIILNGSAKSEAELIEAARRGSVVNIDHEDEIAVLAHVATRENPIRVNIRLKLHSEAFDVFDGTFFKSSASISAVLRRSKWGHSLPAVVELVKRVTATEALTLLGFTCHVGRFSNQPESYAVVAREAARAVNGIHAATGFWPSVLDLGGGWARGREPESRTPDANPHTIDDYAAAVSEALCATLAKRPLPRLWLEPGRYLVGNAVVLLCTVGAVKKDLGLCWAHVDASTNQLMRIDTSRSWYHILPANRMRDDFSMTADVVGPTCIPSILASERDLPPLERGDAIAILDAGMYAEVIANQFNGIARPANVLVSPDGVAVIKRRETFEDIFGGHCIPHHLVEVGG
jgi:diaminopimelate decarboxylase